MSKICCFTGHRPKNFPWGNNIEAPEAQKLLDMLKTEIENTIADGYTDFVCGGAEGVDTYAAKIILDLKQKYPNIKLILAIPFREHNNFVTDPWYIETRKRADETVFISEKDRSRWVYFERDRYMVDKSNRIIAVFDERAGLRGGTFYTLQYAEKKKIEIRQIPWMDCLNTEKQ